MEGEAAARRDQAWAAIAAARSVEQQVTQNAPAASHQDQSNTMQPEHSTAPPPAQLQACSPWGFQQLSEKQRAAMQAMAEAFPTHVVGYKLEPVNQLGSEVHFKVQADAQAAFSDPQGSWMQAAQGSGPAMGPPPASTATQGSARTRSKSRPRVVDAPAGASALPAGMVAPATGQQQT